MFKITRGNDMGISVCNSSKKVNSIDIELEKQREKDQKYFNPMKTNEQLSDNETSRRIDWKTPPDPNIT